MPYSSKAIANYFLEVAKDQNEQLTPMKVQKLVYFANGWHLAIKGARLINEQVEAWPYGPVIPSLYRAFRRFGNQTITSPAIRLTPDLDSRGRLTYHETVPRIDDPSENAAFTKAFLNRIWEIYGGYSAIQLSNETHKDGSPWDAISKQYNGAIPKRTDIPEELMRGYFRSLARPMAVA